MSCRFRRALLSCTEAAEVQDGRRSGHRVSLRTEWSWQEVQMWTRGESRQGNQPQLRPVPLQNPACRAAGA